MSFKICQNWIKLSIRSTFYAFVLLILLTNESRILVSCQSVEVGVRAVETTSPQLLQQTGGDLTPSETSNLPGLDSVRGFLVRNHQWITPVAAAVPAKLATFMALRALRSQAVGQELEQQQMQINGMRNADGDFGGPENGGEFGCGGGGCEGQKNSMMVFVGDGNIQVKNHGDDDEEESDDKYYTYQKINLENKFMNKDMSRMDDRIDGDVRRILRKSRKIKSKAKKKKKRRQHSSHNSHNSRKH